VSLSWLTTLALDRRDLKTDAPARTSAGGGSDTAN
jgi:hypothetical protein